ncbi:hypothetical protein HK104_009590 [Borealophlyctis nickersoniae]|nr:hypothetical protein HK104_009590 [Borealophlyctis nickersoniae]
MTSHASGCQQDSPALLRGLYALLNPVQIVDVSRSNPEALLRAFQPYFDRCRVLVCGGDGTIAWVFSILDKLVPEGGKRPPVGILPLGTGNDLSRVLGWGGGWAGEDIPDIVRDIVDAEEVDLDRWEVIVEPKPTQPAGSLVGRAMRLAGLRKTKRLVMNNYFSLGTDASVALEFHTTRLQKPHFFRSRFFNKLIYTFLGTKEQMSRVLSMVGLNKAAAAAAEEEELSDITDEALGSLRRERSKSAPVIHHAPLLSSKLHMDAIPSPTPTDLSGVGALIVLNIASYGGGGQIYAPAESEGFEKSLYDDGKLEVLTVDSPLHLGASVVGLASPSVVGQAKMLRIDVEATEIAMQVDGEPWKQTGPCTVSLSLLGRTKMLKKKNEVVVNSSDVVTDSEITDSEISEDEDITY